MGLATCGSRDKAEIPAENAVVVNETVLNAAPPITGEWSQLQPMIGEFPRQSGLFENSPIAPQLKTLLGDKYETFITNMQVQSPLTQDGSVLFTTGNKQHEGGSEMAYIIIDPSSKALDVGIWEAGKLTTYKTEGSNLPKPEDVQALIGNS